MALVIGNLYINPIITFNPNSSKEEGKKITTITRKILQLALDVILWVSESLHKNGEFGHKPY